MPKKTYSIGQKLAILRELDQTLQGGGSLRSVARKHAIQPCQLRNWKKKRGELLATSNKKSTIHTGKTSSIKHLEEQLIGWALDMRADGIPLTYKHLQVKACQLDVNFRNLSVQQQYHRIRRLCIVNCLVHRRKTTVAQQHPQELLDAALAFLVDVRVRFAFPNVDRSFVLNMDQTPVFFGTIPGTTLQLQGSSTVSMRVTPGHKARARACLTVSANGDKLKPMLIFKGTPNGDIARTELPNHPHSNDLFLCCQSNAWQDDENMLQWIDHILVPYLQEKAQGVPAFLLLDAFTVHHSETTKNRLSQLGIEVIPIPKGCTGMVQPVDVGLAKPFKDRLRHKWWDWVLEVNVGQGVLLSPSRPQISTWVYETWQSMPASMVRNSWLKKDLSYFPEEEVGDNIV